MCTICSEDNLIPFAHEVSPKVLEARRKQLGDQLRQSGEGEIKVVGLTEADRKSLRAELVTKGYRVDKNTTFSSAKFERWDVFI